MPIYLKQSTASQEVPLGHFLDSTDGNTEETGLTIGNTDIKIWKAGATTLANKNSGGATHIANGVYYAVLDATDTNTLGPLVIFCHPSGALSVRVECVVLAANVYDSLIGASDYLQTDTIQIEGSDATDQLDAHDGNPPTAAAIRSEIDSNSTQLAAILEDTGTTLPGTLSTISGYIDTEVASILAAVDTEVAAILADTNELQGDWTNGGRLDLLIDGIKAVTDAIPDAGALTTLGGKVDSILEDTGTTIPSTLSTIDGKADTIISDTNELQTDWTNGGRLDLIIDAILADTNELQTDDIPGAISALNNISAADVWDASSATLSLSFETIIDRLYRFLTNKMNITDATGAVALRNEADNGDIATQSITDDDTTTVRTALSWS